MDVGVRLFTGTCGRMCVMCVHQFACEWIFGQAEMFNHHLIVCMYVRMCMCVCVCHSFLCVCMSVYMYTCNSISMCVCHCVLCVRVQVYDATKRELDSLKKQLKEAEEESRTTRDKVSKGNLARERFL